MTNELVTEAEVERALDFLRDSAAELGAAKEAAVRCGHMVRHKRALEMKKCNGMSVSAQEREAEASLTMLEAYGEDAIAAGEYEKVKSLREAAALKIEVWRSMGANYRAMKI